MSWLNDWLPHLPRTAPLPIVLGLALLLGVRHAVDPDHLFAVTTLVGGEAKAGARAAARLGLAWGAGHALTLSALGAPVVLAEPYLPERVQRTAEALVGIIIVALAARLLLRWRSERLHVHVHEHEHPSDVRHAHVHAHPHGSGSCHAHHAAPERPRTAAAAFGIGLLHGVGGSAGPTLLILASLDSKPLAIACLLVLAVGTAVSMSALSTGFGVALARAPAGTTPQRGGS